MDHKRDHMEMNFEYFQIQKWLLEKERKKQIQDGIIYLVTGFLSWVMVLKLCIFYNFVLTATGNRKSVKAIYLYASERSPTSRKW